jgi:hypothetical protein
MKTFRELVEEKKTVELTDNPTRKEVDKAWPKNLTYKGEDFFNDVYLKFLDWFENHTKELKDASWTETNSEEVQDEDGNWYDDEFEETITREKQESYCGYIPSMNVFITGFDMWEGYENPAGIVYWKALGNKKFRIIKEEIDYSSSMMYGRTGAYKKLHKEHKDLLDLRLD